MLNYFFFADPHPPTPLTVGQYQYPIFLALRAQQTLYFYRISSVSHTCFCVFFRALRALGFQADLLITNVFTNRRRISTISSQNIPHPFSENTPLLLTRFRPVGRRAF